MLPPIAYDLTRLCYAPPTPTPRGIDRVDLALATFFFQTWPGDCVATLPTPWGVRCFDRRFGLEVVELARTTWRENTAAADDLAYSFVKEALKGAVTGRRHSSSQKKPPVWKAVSARIWTMIQHVGIPIGSSAAARVPQGAVYLNVGHVGLAVDQLLDWLPLRPDLKPVFMIHDTIPLDHSEFVSSSSHSFHKRMIANTARYASGLMVTTEAAKRMIVSALGEKGLPSERIFASPLPVNDVFLNPMNDADLDSISYFVFCGSIEPRKNLILLLNVWRDVVARLGPPAPKLVVVGTRTSGISETAAMLDRCTAIRDHVVEVEGLSTNGLRLLIGGAKALLMPSFAEGFGIPILEALATSTAVIASDIAAHQEAGGTAITYLGATDGPRWVDAVIAHHLSAAGIRSEARISDWKSYCSALKDFVATL